MQMFIRASADEIKRWMIQGLIENEIRRVNNAVSYCCHNVLSNIMSC